MRSLLLQTAARLSNQDLIERVKQLVRHENEATAELIAHIDEMDRRRLHLGQGFPSLFTYCTRVLHLSEYAAYARIQAARLCRRLPDVLDRIADGSVNLTTVSLLWPHLGPANHVELLDEAAHKSKRQVEEIVARLQPRDETPAYVRKLPDRRPSEPDRGAVHMVPVRSDVTPPTDEFPESPPATPGGGWSAPSAPARAVVTPVSPGNYRIQITAGAGTYLKFERARDLLRHQIPDGNPTAIIDRALTVLLADLERRRFAAVPRPRMIEAGVAAGRSIRSRYIPAEVRRLVWKRDRGRCAYVGADGRRCEARNWLEFHHRRPYAHGGPATADNIEIRCRAHNQYEAELAFGGDPLETDREGNGGSA